MSASKPSEPAETGPLRIDRGRHPAEPARPLVVQARESSPFTRKCRRITAQANTRPSLHGGPGKSWKKQPLNLGGKKGSILLKNSVFEITGFLFAICQ